MTSISTFAAFPLKVHDFMAQSELLDRLESDLKKLLELVRSQFTLLPTEALQVRPGPERWNALECFAHLNAHFDYFLPRIELAIHKAKARSWAPAGERQQNWYGRRAIRAVDPLQMDKNRRKSPKRINPKYLQVRPIEVKAFLINMEMLLRLLQQAREVDLNKAKVTHFRWPHFSFLLGDLLEYVVLHAQRHTLQAQAAAPKY
ncbi:MAG: DinB family protein [Haliscomenobacteraceae bacterium CHB4]|nr:DinB family protein [Haliscomenobacteraceae bacterium CHB4]